MTDTSPERIWIETTPYDFPGYSPCWVWHSGEALEATEGLVEYVRADTIAALRAAPVAVRERAARIVQPAGKRPCDCDRCYCQNVGDAEAVAAWDAQNAAAEAIRALPLNAPAPVDPVAEAASQVRLAKEAVDALGSYNGQDLLRKADAQGALAVALEVLSSTRADAPPTLAEAMTVPEVRALVEALEPFASGVMSAKNRARALIAIARMKE
jgi:hypothetical protein